MTKQTKDPIREEILDRFGSGFNFHVNSVRMAEYVKEKLTDQLDRVEEKVIKNIPATTVEVKDDIKDKNSFEAYVKGMLRVEIILNQLKQELK